VLYEMATGKLAFQGKTWAVIFKAILDEMPPPPTESNPQVPAPLDDIVQKALEKDRELRYQSAADLRSDLKRLNRDTESGRAPLPNAIPRPNRKWRAASIIAGFGLTALVLAGVVYLKRNPFSSPTPDVRTTHKQFTFTGNAEYPAISPDGLFVAYVTYKSGEQQQLMIRGPDGATIELTHGDDIYDPRWSPDGSELAFTKSFNLYVVSRLGGPAREIGKGMYVCWSSDGSEIFTGRQAQLGANGELKFELSSVNKVTGQVRHIRLPEYTWLFGIDSSPKTGQLLVHVEVGERSQILSLKPDGTQLQKVVDEPNKIESPRWSPVDDAIYYLRRKESTFDLVRVRLSEKHVEPAVLVTGLQLGDYFTISADGHRLAYSRTNDISNLWRIQFGNGEAGKRGISQITSGTSYYGLTSFSPDGRWLVVPMGPSKSNTDIYKMKTEGGQLIRLTFFENAMTSSPAWSADGQYIAFISNQNGSTKVWTVSANSNAPQPLEKTNAGGSNHYLAWYPSQDIVYQQSGVQNFIRIDSKTQEEKLVLRDTTGRWVPDKPIFSPDGNNVAVYWNRKPVFGVWSVSLEPYSEILLLNGYAYPIGWSLDGKYVFTVKGRQVSKVALARPNQAVPVASLPADLIEEDYISVSPDGREAVASIGETKSDVWIMENFDPAIHRKN